MKGWKQFWLGVAAAVAATVIGGAILFSVENPIKGFGAKPNKRLSYGITEVKDIYLRPADTNLHVNVLSGTNHIPVESLWGYRVRIWNSGKEPLKDLIVQYRFSTNGSFYCLAEVHNPQPKHEVGDIGSVPPGESGVAACRYQLLNPEHSDEVFFVVNVQCDVQVVARDEGLSIKREFLEKRTSRSWTSSLGPGVVAGLVAGFAYLIADRKRNSKIETLESQLEKFATAVRADTELLKQANSQPTIQGKLKEIQKAADEIEKRKKRKN
jgi:hypothetical protein